MLIVVLVMMIIVNGDGDGKMRTVMKMKTRMTSMAHIYQIPPGCKYNQAEGWSHSNLRCLHRKEGSGYTLSPFCYNCDQHDYHEVN